MDFIGSIFHGPIYPDALFVVEVSALNVAPGSSNPNSASSVLYNEVAGSLEFWLANPEQVLSSG
ncbi:hypothetical protein [uncultured Caulobacter sp.]|uniref:hypothetical protein n=1 Tax=uncultured Caulobacter sp. TaxID=158749 RepID=UPI0026038C07|nr:hypothetical protein [uncultured Caulobacter sp.]